LLRGEIVARRQNPGSQIANSCPPPVFRRKTATRFSFRKIFPRKIFARGFSRRRKFAVKKIFVQVA
jgi:hypothetical protein